MHEQKTQTELDVIRSLLSSLTPFWDQRWQDHVYHRAAELLRPSDPQPDDTHKNLQPQKQPKNTLNSLINHYSLDTDHGLALMSLAEALLRIPDVKTQDLLLKDKITSVNWNGPDKLDTPNSQKTLADVLIRLSGIGLSLSKITYTSLLEHMGAPVIRAAAIKAMRVLGRHFVLGQDMSRALSNGDHIYFKHNNNAPSQGGGGGGYYYASFDMLGEAAHSHQAAEIYFKSYFAALESLAAAPHLAKKSLSVKLSALHPRYEYKHAAQCIPDLVDKMLVLCRFAKQHDIHITIDAEESYRLNLHIDIFCQLKTHDDLAGWDHLGMVVQAYHKRAFDVIKTLTDFGRKHGCRLPIRLVKGAYWDSEIKHAQINGLDDYPIFTQKYFTDISYLACAHELLNHLDIFYPMFATHNAHSLAAILQMASNIPHASKANPAPFEFQKLHGMAGNDPHILHDQIRRDYHIPIGIYAPVGSHKDLLPYLVRRLLENGANSSFINQLTRLQNLSSSRDNATYQHMMDDLLADPIVKAQHSLTPSSIPLPADLYSATSRQNSRGYDLHDGACVQALLRDMQPVFQNALDWKTGQFLKTTHAEIQTSYHAAQTCWPAWRDFPLERRADLLNKIADLYDQNAPALMAHCMAEGHKTLDDCVAEIREAIDFCRYYAAQGRHSLSPQTMPGPTGESNRLSYHGRGVFICISPWNFPLAIFTGQIVAALMAGNCVLAKPAEQTPYCAKFAVDLMHRAMDSLNIPRQILSLIFGDGQTGQHLVQLPNIAGICFTGSHDVAKKISADLAAKPGPITPFIAETGGQNVMMIDSSALPEQACNDVLHSAFYSAGQRCSAARIVLVQDDIAAPFITLLSQSMQCLTLGDPRHISTDIGPVIDRDAHDMLTKHCAYLDQLDGARLLASAPIPALPATPHRAAMHFFAPRLYEINDLSLLQGEVFGPILHLKRFTPGQLPDLITQINDMGYGLTFGVHSRIASRYHWLSDQISAGNCYINRTMTGAVVGTQPFGGRGLSGTGPKAGGPNYLRQFCHEKTITINTAAIGGNTSLIMQSNQI